PLVGLLIGLLLCLGYYLFSQLLPKPLSIWLTIGLLALLTRGLHLDGFADTIDGLASGGSKEKILEVMRDSRIGPFGVIGLILLVGAKYLTLHQMTNSSLYASIILMTVLGRHAMVLVCYRSPYARFGEGLGKPFSENLHFRETIVSFFTSLAISLLIVGMNGLLIFVGITLFNLGYRSFFIKRLGGVTGDVLGAANELTELLAIIFMLVLDRVDIL
ncbi:MAG: adenosylcobinamide-GDP ribazoletransferase, partial [Thermodesulfobacteriota bacterium]